MSGVESNVAEMRRVLAAAANRLRTAGRKTILFIDEIHHFNKAQQDILLPAVEAGTLRLIGATTYNPFFYVNSALVSRSQVFQLEPLRVEDLETLIDRALTDKERGLGKLQCEYGPGCPPASGETQRWRCAQSAKRSGNRSVNDATVAPRPEKCRSVKEQVAPGGWHHPLHTRSCGREHSAESDRLRQEGDAHYDTISAFIKSMRASDEKGAMYWLAKMLHAGEDFRFIARRIVIFASEDVGPGGSAGVAPGDRHATGGGICWPARSAHSVRPRHHVHVPGEEEP